MKLTTYLGTVLIACFLTSLTKEKKITTKSKNLEISQSSYFTLVKSGDLHYFLTPNRKPFKAIGINHFHNMKFTNYDSIVKLISELGFTSGGYQGPKWIWNRYPYTKGLNFLKTSIYRKGDKFEYEDVFDPKFLIVLEDRIKKVALPMSQNRNLIGYFWTDLPVWHRKKNGGWVKYYKNLDPNSSGYKIFTQWKKDNPNAEEKLFTVEIAKHVYSQGYRILKKYDNNHLIFGDRFHEVDMPETIVKEMLPYIDALAIQPTNNFNRKFYDSLYTKYNKPIYIADHVTSFSTKDYPITMGQVAKDSKSYLEYYTNTIKGYFELPYIIGFNKCQFQDDVRPNLLKQGIVRFDGIPYPILDGLKNANQNATRSFEKMLEINNSKH